MNTVRSRAVLCLVALGAFVAGLVMADNSSTPSKAYTFSSGTTILSSQVNENFDRLYTGLANVGTANIITSGVSTDELAAASVSTAKIADGALSADTTGRAKVADRFLTPVKLDPTAFFPSAGKVEVTQNTSPSAASFTVTAEYVVTTDGSNRQIHHSLSETVNVANSGANGFDTGTIQANSQNFLWVIAKEDGTVDCLMSASSTAPTMPSGYTYKRRIGAFRADASAQILALKQTGATVLYYNPQRTELNNDTSSTFNTWTVASTAAALYRPVPTTAVSVRLALEERETSGGFAGILLLHLYTGAATGGSARSPAASPVVTTAGPVGIVTMGVDGTNFGVNTAFGHFEIPLVSNSFKTFKEVNGGAASYGASFAWVVGYVDNI